ETVSRQAKGMNLDTILAGLDILSATKARLRGSSHGRVLLEMALVRLARLDDLVSLTQLGQWLAQPNTTPMPRTAGLAPAAPATSRPGAVQPPEGAKKKPVADGEAAAAAPATLSAQSLPQVWQEVLTQIGPLLASEVEKAGLPAISGPNTLVLHF